LKYLLTLCRLRKARKELISLVFSHRDLSQLQSIADVVTVGERTQRRAKVKRQNRLRREFGRFEAFHDRVPKVQYAGKVYREFLLRSAGVNNEIVALIPATPS
jgi:hypothetical protein